MDSFAFQLPCFVVLILFLAFQECTSLNLEGRALLEFREGVDNDPYCAFANWNPNDRDPCMWLGVQCVDGEVQMLDLQGLSLEGILAPELGKLSHLRSLVLYKNRFSGIIPKELGGLMKLEILDLRENNLSGSIPAEIVGMLSLKHPLLCDNKFRSRIPPEIWNLNLLSEIQFDTDLTSDVAPGIVCINRKLGCRTWQSKFKPLTKADAPIVPIKRKLIHYLNMLPWFKVGRGSLCVHGEDCYDHLPNSSEPYVQRMTNFAPRRLLLESSNLPAAPANGNAFPGQMNSIPTSHSSGAFPAVPNKKKNQSNHLSPTRPYSYSYSNNQSAQMPTDSHLKPTKQQHLANGSSQKRWKFVFVIPAAAFLLTIAAAMLCFCRSRGVTTIGPWKTGLSGQLQKVFVTGVPILNRSELEIACEDFSNIIETLADCTVFKGTLSSGVEIAVASTAIASSKGWSKCSEMNYRKKIDTLSRINHKNFVNLLGYCEEDEPFIRMIVFEYAPNGTLFEHLHVKEFEHLDWNARTRIIMGIAYCLQYMHHGLSPPVAHPNLQSASIYLTDDYAAKVADISFWTEISKWKIVVEDESEYLELPPLADPETNVYSFGILLLEIISGKLPHSEEQGSLVNWAAEYLNGKQGISYMIDPTLKSFNNNELDIICEVVQECIHLDPRQRPTMREVTRKLREVLAIWPDAATPKLSPLWWAELEILSVEAT